MVYHIPVSVRVCIKNFGALDTEYNENSFVESLPDNVILAANGPEQKLGFHHVS